MIKDQLKILQVSFFVRKIKRMISLSVSLGISQSMGICYHLMRTRKKGKDEKWDGFKIAILAGFKKGWVIGCKKNPIRHR